LNHRKKTKAGGSRLIPRKHTETLALLIVTEPSGNLPMSLFRWIETTKVTATIMALLLASTLMTYYASFCSH